MLQKFIARQQELHQKVMQKRQQQQQTAAASVFQNVQQPTQELYELPPDTNNFGQGAGFGDSFVPNSSSAQCGFFKDFLLALKLYHFKNE